MEIKDMLKKVDHTLLKQTAVMEDIERLCDDGIEYGVASVCIPPAFVRRAKVYTMGRIPICTVIGFPNGYNTTDVKVYETEKAIYDGADEIDMVININALKDKDYSYVLNEIKAVRRACEGKILKVIIETCLLTDKEKIKMCKIVGDSGAEFIKTSTGFGKGGASRHDINLIRKNLPEGLKIKAAGGITKLADADKYITMGAQRLGTSRIVEIVKEEGLI